MTLRPLFRPLRGANGLTPAFAWVLAFTLALVLAGAPQARAQGAGYPSKPIRIVVPFGPGSGSDQMARLVADRLAEQMKTTVLVENREGAGGVIGTQSVARSTPDGYTLVLVSNTMLVAPLLSAKPPYDALRDFTPVVRFSANPLVLLTAPTSPYKTVADMAAWLRAHSDTASYATSGKGSHGHLEAARLMRHLGLAVPDVPYKTTTQALTDTAMGRVAFYVAGLGPALGQIKAGRLRALAVGGTHRAPALPDVPTYAEATGQPDHAFVAWVGLLAPAGTPRDVVQRLYAEFAKMAEAPVLQERLAMLNNEWSLLAPEPFGAQMRAESAQWAALVQTLGLRTE